MTTIINFNEDWTVGPQVSVFDRVRPSDDRTPVTLPHDALISAQRAPEHGRNTGFFPSAAVDYRKTFDAPEEWRGKYVTLHFDGAYRDAMVYVNNALAGNRANGYVPFDVEIGRFLKFGDTNTVRVEVRAHDDSRWYSGVGLYRGVRLEVRDTVHIRPGELHVTTPSLEDDLAVVEFAIPVENLGVETRALHVRTTVENPAGAVVAERVEPLTAFTGASTTARLRVFVDDPQRWSVDRPQLYTARAELLEGTDVVDEATVRLGMRTLQLDPRHGLRINGESVKLRGTCIHHDNGPLGSAAFADAERRQIRLLKEAGFNAIRSAHNPLSEVTLQACDELGMIVMDESFDMWTVHKTSFDYSIAFPEWWERDIEAMVLRDRNHPSVIFYSIGNEIMETGNPAGGDLSRQIAEKVRSLDPHRFVTNGVNCFLSVLDTVAALMSGGGIDNAFGGEEDEPDKSASGGLNAVMGASSDRMQRLNQSSLVTESTAESFAALDVAGLNYGDDRYAMDGRERPHRIIIGTETYAGRIATNWEKVMEHPHVLGDFTWTGWDYLGEAGIGRPKYEGDNLYGEAEYPWLTAWCGDIDITGFRRPASYYREIVFGLRQEPYIAVRSPEAHGRQQMWGMWAWTDSQGSWTLDVEDNTPLTVEVYSPHDEVELLLNGKSIGREPAGAERGFMAVFEVPYAAGELTAVGWQDGERAETSTLVSGSGTAMLHVAPESTSVQQSPGALVHVPVEIRDGSGTLLTTREDSVRISLDGPAVLQGFGSGRPDNSESFVTDRHSAFRGRVLAILRPTGPGDVTVTVSAEGLESKSVSIEVTQ